MFIDCYYDIELTPLQFERLENLEGKHWRTPLQLGGTCGQPSAQLRALCNKGLAEWKWRSTGTGVAGLCPRGSKEYRLTHLGDNYLWCRAKLNGKRYKRKIIR